MFNIIKNLNFNKKPNMSRFDFCPKKIKEIYKFDIPSEFSIYNQGVDFEITDILFEQFMLMLLLRNGEIYFYNIITKKANKFRIFNTQAKRAQSISYNKKRNTLFIIALFNVYRRKELKCFEIKIETIKERIETKTEFMKEDLALLLENETFLPPSFIEYVDFLDCLLIKNALGSVKILEMEDYRQRFEITDRDCIDVRKSEDFLLLAKSTNNDKVLKLSIHSINTGRKVNDLELCLLEDCPLTFLEFFKNTLFIKQVNHLPSFINIFSLKKKDIPYEMSDDMFSIYNKDKKLIFLFDKNTILIYNSNEEFVKKIDKEYVIQDISPSDFCICHDYFLLKWKIFNFQEKFSFRSPNLSKSRSSKSSVFKGTELNDFNLISEGSELKSAFQCDLSAIPNEANEECKNNVDEDANQQMTYFSFDLFDLDDVNTAKTFSFKISSKYDICSMIMSRELMTLFCVTSDAEIFEINL